MVGSDCGFIQTVAQGPVFQPIWHWFWQLYRHALAHTNAPRAHTAAPSLGSCVDKWVEGAEVLVRVCGRYTQVILYSRRFLQHDRETEGLWENVMHFLNFILCLLCQKATLVMCTCVWHRQAERASMCVASFSLFPSLHLYLWPAEKKKELFFSKETRSIGIASRLIRSWYIGYRPGHNEDVNCNATFPRALTRCK